MLAKCFGIGLALVALAISVHSGLTAWRHHRDFYVWIDARPLDVTLDLTRPSVQTVPFTQTCSLAHGESIYFDTGEAGWSEAEVAERFAGLDGTLKIRDAAGKEIASRELTAESVSPWGLDPMLTGIFPFAKGDYTAEIRIERGASDLPGSEHRLYARYELCGLELLPAYLLGAVSAVAGLVGLIAAAITATSIRRHGFWPHPTTCVETDSAESASAGG